MSEAQKNTPQTRCGYVAIIGRPNVGKSTLMNKILGQKISITCRKPQTTRHQILGIHTVENKNLQLIFVDTPGMHTAHQDKAINRVMNKAAYSALQFVDVILWLIEPVFTAEDQVILENLKKQVLNQNGELLTPVVLGINKMDILENRNELLPYIQTRSKDMPFSAIHPISAKQGTALDGLEDTLAKYLPQAEFFYDAEQITTRSSRFLAAEIIREKLMRFLGQELPYELTVEITWFKIAEDGLIDIAATIFVERETQKRMIIGKGGSKLKQVGTEARQDLSKLLDAKIFLKLWVKVKQGWSDDERALQRAFLD